MAQGEDAYRSGAVRPLECYKLAWTLIRRNYWSYFGITVVGVMIAGWANFPALLALAFLNVALGVAGLAFCYFGALFILPLSMAPTAFVYRQAFPGSTTSSPGEQHPEQRSEQ